MSLTAENCLLCGQLHVQEKGKTWTKTWAAVTRTEPLVLYLQSSGQVKAECIYATVVFRCSGEVIYCSFQRLVLLSFTANRTDRKSACSNLAWVYFHA